MFELFAVAALLVAISSSREGSAEVRRRSQSLSSGEGVLRKFRSSSTLELPEGSPPDLDPDAFSRVSSMSGKEIYDLVVDLIIAHVGKWTAFTHQDELKDQYETYRMTVRSELGFGPRSKEEVDRGIALIERLGDAPLSPEDRKTMLAVGVVRVPLILKGEE